MPIYAYKCKCGHTEDQYRQMRQHDEPRPCPECGGTLVKDVVESMRVHTDTGYQVPILSHSAGIHPDQIPEAKRRFPHHEFHPDGRMIFNGHQHRERCLRDIGLYDKN